MEEAIKNIQNELDNHIKSFSKRVESNKRKAFYFKLITLSLSFAATVALGVKGWGDPDELKNLAFICTAMISFFSSIDMYFNHRGLWVRFVETRNELYSINSDFNYYITANKSKIDIKELDKFHSRIQSALNETNNWWTKERSKKHA